MKDDQSISLNIKLTIYQFEGENSFSGSYNAFLKIDGKELGQFTLGVPSIFPLLKSSSYFQIIIKESLTNNSLGSLTMTLNELYKLKAHNNKHWVTLFEDPEDDIYDGDYKEDDMEVPRILIYHEILRIKTDIPIDCNIPIMKREETLEVVPELYKDEMGAEIVQSQPKVRKRKNEHKKLFNKHITKPKTSREEISDSKNNSARSETKDKKILDNTHKITPFTTKPEYKINETIEKLTRENGKLHDELKELEKINSEFLDKYQTETNEHNNRISELLHTKGELQEKIFSLERNLESRNSELQNLSDELKQIKENNEIQIPNMKLKVEHYEDLIEEYKTIIKLNEDEPSSKTKIDEEINKHIEKLKELERQYVDQLNETRQNFHNAEIAIKQSIMEDKKSAEEKIRKLEEENNQLKELRDELKNTLKITNEKVDRLEHDIVDLERKKGLELEELNKKNIELNSLVEQLKVTIEQNDNRISEKDKTLNYKEKQYDLLIKENEGLKNELTIEKNNLNSMDQLLKDKTSENDSLKRRLHELESELLKKSLIEEELSEKSKTINSLQIINDECKKSNERLKQSESEFSASTKEFQDKYFDLQHTVETYESNIKKTNDELLAANKIIEEQKAEAINQEKKHIEEIDILKQQLSENDKTLKSTEAEKNKLIEDVKNLEEKTKEMETVKTKAKSTESKVQEITSTLMQQNKLAWELEAQLHQTQEDLDNLRREASMTMAENIELKNELIGRDKEIESLTVLLGNHNQSADLEDSKNSQIIYTSDKSDKVDQMFALYINAVRCPVKLKRIGDGQYIFGSKKIFAKIQNEKLVIRVGGGYMMIEDFLTTYTAQELSKMKRAITNENEVDKSMRSNSTEVTFEEEPESDTSQSSIITTRTRPDHLIFTKSSAKPTGEKCKVPFPMGVRSRSPGIINSANRGKVLTEQNSFMSKTVKASAKKSTGEEKENTSMKLSK